MLSTSRIASISPKQIDEIALFSGRWYKFPKIKSWLKSFCWGMVKNECGQSCLWTLKLTASQERTDGTSWFFTCLYNFTQIKRWLKIFGVSMVKNGCDQSGDGTLKLTVFEEGTDGIYKLSFCILIHDHKN